MVVHTINSVLSTKDHQTLEGYLTWKWWGNGNIRETTLPYRSICPGPII